MSIDIEMKHILERRKSIIFGIGLLFIGIAIGIGTTNYLPLLTKTTNVKSQSQPVKEVDEAEGKKQALAKFYNEISTANDNKDWPKIYELVPQSVRNNVTKTEFIAYYNSQAEKNKIVSEQTKVNSIQVNGDKGIVDRTRIICTSKECTGDNRKEENAKREYIYVDGKWHLPDPKPSERALKTSTDLYLYSSDKDKKDFITNNGYGSSKETFAIENYAIYLDTDLTRLGLLEAGIEKYKKENDPANKPKVIYQPQPVYIDTPTYQAPIIQQPSYPRNCTSNTVGNYTYTNCY